MKFICFFIFLPFLMGCSSQITPEDLDMFTKAGDWKKLVEIMTKNPDFLVRAQVPYYLVKINDPNIVPILMQALQRRETMNSSASALAQLRAEQAIPQLISAFSLPYGDKKTLLQDIAKFCPNTQPFLMQILQNESWDIRNTVVECLAEYGDIATIPALESLSQEISMSKIPEDNPEVKYLIDFIQDEIPQAVGKIQFRHQLSSVDNLLLYGWKKVKDNWYAIPCREYFRKTAYIKAYQTEWFISSNMMGYTFSEIIPEKSKKPYYLGRGTLSAQKNTLTFDGFYSHTKKYSQEDENWERMNVNIHQLVCDWETRTIYFSIQKKEQDVVEVHRQATIEEFLTSVAKKK